MEEDLKYPFRLKTMLFSKVEISRKPKLPKPLHLSMAIRLELDLEKFPDEFQVTTEVSTVREESVNLAVHLVGIFETIEGEQDVDRELVADFINDRGFYVLFPVLRQQIYEQTVAMGMPPIELPLPIEVDFPLGETDTEEKEAKVRI